MSATYGRTSPPPLAHFDQASSCWKMSQDTFPWEESPLLETLPPWGMTRNGELSERPTPGRLTAARESSSLLLPTVVTKNNENRQSPGYGPNLGTVLLSTPTAAISSDGITTEAAAQRNAVRRRGNLVKDVLLLPTPTRRDYKGHNQRRDATCLPGALLPTPAVNDMGAGKTLEWWDEWTATMQAKHGNGNGHGKSLSIEVLRSATTGPPSDDGNTS